MSERERELMKEFLEKKKKSSKQKSQTQATDKVKHSNASFEHMKKGRPLSK